MSCKFTDLGNGDFAVTCSRGQRQRAPCDVCKERPHTKLCDYPLSGKKAGATCSRKLCDRCAKQAGLNVDLCPPHAKLGLPQTQLNLGETK